MSSQSVLLIGASGYIGRIVAQEFLSQKTKFARVAILTDASKVDKFAEISSQGMEIVVGSFLEPSSFKGKSHPSNISRLQYSNFFPGFTTVICMLGNHAMAQQPAIIDAAISAGITHFYPSEFGSDISQAVYRSNRFFRDKHITREHLVKTAEAHGGFGYTLIIYGGFAEYAAHLVFGVDTEKGTFEFFGPKEKREPFTGVRESVEAVLVVFGDFADIFQTALRNTSSLLYCCLNPIPVLGHHAVHFASPPRHTAGRKS
jgi:hypothetical protein